MPTGKPAISRPREKQVEHRDLLGDPDRRVVEGDRVAEHRDRRPRRAAGEDRGDQVRRRHQPVAVVVVLVDADAVEPALLGVDELVDVARRSSRPSPRGRTAPGSMSTQTLRCLLVEVLREVRIRHEVEPQQLHWRPSIAGRRPARPRPSPTRIMSRSDNVRREWPTESTCAACATSWPSPRSATSAAPRPGCTSHAAAVAAHPRARARARPDAVRAHQPPGSTLTPAGERLLGEARRRAAGRRPLRPASGGAGSRRRRRRGRSATATAARAAMMRAIRALPSRAPGGRRARRRR